MRIVCCSYSLWCLKKNYFRHTTGAYYTFFYVSVLVSNTRLLRIIILSIVQEIGSLLPVLDLVLAPAGIRYGL